MSDVSEYRDGSIGMLAAACGYQPWSDLCRIHKTTRALVESCEYRDNGKEFCRHCRGWAHMDEPVRHERSCPVPRAKELEAELRANFWSPTP